MCYFFIGDIMKKSFLFFLIGSIVLGFISAQIVYSRYIFNLKSLRFNSYFLQIGKYDDEESIINDFGNDFKYLVLNEDDSYNVYVGITTSLYNVDKIKDIYEEKDYSVVVKPVVVDNVEFISNLEEFDKLILEVDSSNVVSIMNVILSSYEEIVLGK